MKSRFKPILVLLILSTVLVLLTHKSVPIPFSWNRAPKIQSEDLFSPAEKQFNGGHYNQVAGEVVYKVSDTIGNAVFLRDPNYSGPNWDAFNIAVYLDDADYEMIQDRDLITVKTNWTSMHLVSNNLAILGRSGLMNLFCGQLLEIRR